MALSFRQIRYFCAVAELGSLSSAARAMNVTPSSITSAIQDLESDLACRLFERHSRGMELSAKGQQFLRYAKNILESIALAQRSIDKDTAALRGRLSLGVTSLVAGYVLPELLSRLRQASPDLEIVVTEDGKDDLEHLLIGGELDAAAIIMPSDHGSDALSSHVIETSPYRVWCATNHPIAKLSEVDAAALSSAGQILLLGDEIAAVAELHFHRRGIRPRILLRTQSIEAVRSLVATGAGVAVMPDIAYRRWSLEGDRVEARILSDAPEPATVAIVWRRGAGLSDAMRNFLTVVNDYHASAGLR